MNKYFKFYFFFFLIATGCGNISEKQMNLKKFSKEGDSLKKIFKLSHFNNPEISFDELLKPSVIMRYSELNCSVCVDSTIIHVKKLEKLNIPVIYVSSYSTRRDLILFKKLNELENDIYETNFESSLDSINMPYLYIVDEDYIQKSVYFPKKENMAEYMLYLRHITKTYFRENINLIK